MINLFDIRVWIAYAFFCISLLLFVFFIKWKKEKQLRIESESGRSAAVEMLGTTTQQVSFYKNKLGDTIAMAKAYDLNVANLKELAKTNNLQWLKKFEGLKKNLSNAKTAQSLDITFDATNVANDTIYVNCKDSLKVNHFNIKDQWTNIDAMVVGTPVIDVKDRLYAVIYSKRPKKWFIKLKWFKREFWAEATNSNPLIRIDSISTIIVH
jgi:hypothetical protein